MGKQKNDNHLQSNEMASEYNSAVYREKDLSIEANMSHVQWCR